MMYHFKQKLCPETKKKETKGYRSTWSEDSSVQANLAFSLHFQDQHSWV